MLSKTGDLRPADVLLEHCHPGHKARLRHEPDILTDAGSQEQGFTALHDAPRAELRRRTVNDIFPLAAGLFAVSRLLSADLS